jgi:hypothetical protein
MRRGGSTVDEEGRRGRNVAEVGLDFLGDPWSTSVVLEIVDEIGNIEPELARLADQITRSEPIALLEEEIDHLPTHGNSRITWLDPPAAKTIEPARVDESDAGSPGPDERSCSGTASDCPDALCCHAHCAARYRDDTGYAAFSRSPS